MTDKLNIVTALIGDNVTISRVYPKNDPIWNLPQEKAERKLIADVQRELLVEADRLAQIKVTERG